MRPNKQGGQTFNRREVGVARNSLYQATFMLSQMDPQTCGTGHCPAYDKLSNVFYMLGVEYETLSTWVSKTREHVSSEEFDDQPFEASIEETQVVMSCVKWITDPEAFTDQMTLSQRQVSQARTMVSRFEGTQS